MKQKSIPEKKQKREIGFIADDVKSIIDGTGIENLVSSSKTDDEDENEYLALSYSKMTCILWGVVKNQKNQIDKLVNEITKIKTQLRKVSSNA